MFSSEFLETFSYRPYRVILAPVWSSSSSGSLSASVYHTYPSSAGVGCKISRGTTWNRQRAEQQGRIERGGWLRYSLSPGRIDEVNEMTKFTYRERRRRSRPTSIPPVPKAIAYREGRRTGLKGVWDAARETWRAIGSETRRLIMPGVEDGRCGLQNLTRRHWARMWEASAFRSISSPYLSTTYADLSFTGAGYKLLYDTGTDLVDDMSIYRTMPGRPTSIPSVPKAIAYRYGRRTGLKGVWDAARET
ncbi:hypothetical protein R3P38DRAFT_2799589 [Favolaschia claudopus]|uniref:Uncharacterized protein n=1 Tax=Favolaschia claudopus TaxID=2862362 RepID=A0AAW0A007_9AGAR